MTPRLWEGFDSGTLTVHLPEFVLVVTKCHGLLSKSPHTNISLFYNGRLLQTLPVESDSRCPRLFRTLPMTAINTP